MTDQITTQQGGNGSTQSVNIVADQTSSAPEDVTAESLGVDKAAFDKYFKTDDKSFDWGAYGKERAWQDKQKQTGQGTGQAAENTGVNAAQSAENTGQQTGQGTGQEQATQAVEQAGLKIDEVDAYLAEHGKLSDEHLTALEKVGIPKDRAQQIAQMMHKEGQAQAQSVLEFFGGADAFGNIRQWAIDNMPVEERQAYQAMLVDPNRWRAAAVDMANRAGAPTKGGGQQTTQQGQRPQTETSQGTADPYKSSAEMVKDQKDPRYRTDASFRHMVVARAAVSDFSKEQRHKFAL